MSRLLNKKLYIIIGVVISILLIFSVSRSQIEIKTGGETSAKYLTEQDTVQDEKQEKVADDEDTIEKYLNFNLNQNNEKNYNSIILADKKINTKLTQFYKHIFNKISENDPKFNKIPAIKVDDNVSGAKDPLTHKTLSQYIKIREKFVKKLKLLHETYFSSLPQKFPDDLYKGNGIVFVGGNDYSWLSLLSIKSLRGAGSKLPIEVMIPSIDEYEVQFCEEILPYLNAKCVLLSNVFDDPPADVNDEKSKVKDHDNDKDMDSKTWLKLNLKSYQYKSLAIISSSFENVLLLDSDNIMISNPDSWFNQEPFTSHGMVLWPDYWKRSTSPYFYDIADINIDYNKRERVAELPYLGLPNQPSDKLNKDEVPLHDFKGSIPDYSTESGQVMINKQTHVKTLLLSLYYNVHGPNYYYKLFSQGQQGEGDKDTFIAAAIKSGEDFYQVKQGIRAFGYFDEGGFHGVCMGQRNPVEDYVIYNDYIGNVTAYQQQSLEPEGEKLNSEDFMKKYNFKDVKESSYVAMHSNHPKLNPLKLFNTNFMVNSNNERIRMFSDLGHFIGFDFELKQWERMNYLLCDLNLSFKCFNSVKRADLCVDIKEQLKFLRENPK